MSSSPLSCLLYTSYEADFSDLHYDALYIKVPGGASVTFEGNRLTSSYIERTEKYSGPSSEYEKPVKLPICEVYNAGEGYGDPNIVVFSGDNQLQVDVYKRQAVCFENSGCLFCSHIDG